MNLLLDTHVLLWALDDSPLLSPEARAAMTNGANIVFVSAATAWEISIKKALGTLRAPTDDYLDELRRHRFTPLNITTEHALAVETLPLHHADPFDRMLVAQAMVERLTLVTHDARMKAYSAPVILT
ncbi:MAG: type II toxin-antitoxin system VapC family toxin [Caldilineales bacterium]|nr:type II toxin-antitoxin system VapC family toxin [Caldilineales bacterium]